MADLFVHVYRPPAPRYALVVVHGTAGHGGCYESFATAMASIGCAVYCLDLRGHGRSPGERGVFTMEAWLADIAQVCREVAAREEVPVVLLGASQGGEVAFHAAQVADAVSGVACMNLLLPAEVSGHRGIAFMRSQAAAGLARRFGDRLRVPLERVIDFAAAYREDPAVLAEKRADPLYVWSYGFASYRSIFAYDPPRPARMNTKPVLVACGGADPVVSAKHCERCFDRIGGPKSLYKEPGAGHQLMRFHTERFVRVLDGWVAHAVLAGGPSPFRARGVIDAFHDREARADGEWPLSKSDRVLVRVKNGALQRGNRFFAGERLTRTGRFVTEVVAHIDEAAWQTIATRLPAGRRMAVLGCGDGTAVARIPRVQEWSIDAFDVDEDALLAAAIAHPTLLNVRWQARDVRDGLGDAKYDVIYAHGIFDHASDHDAVVRAAAKALAPGGRFFYVTPDRNWYTWLAFVSVGPRFVFGLRGYDDVHDFRRFVRPREIDALLQKHGLKPLGEHVGISYRLDPLRIAWHARRRRPNALDFVNEAPRWFGFAGEYVGGGEKR